MLPHFNRRKRTVGNKPHMDETYIAVRQGAVRRYRRLNRVH
jgi:transposase-like protein